MLKYLYTVTEDLLAVTTLITFLYVVSERRFGSLGRRAQQTGIIVGLIGSAVFASIRAFTNLVRKTASNWNFYSYFGIFLFGLLYFIFMLIRTGFFTKAEKKPNQKNNAWDIICNALGAFLSAFVIFDKCRSVLWYPFVFNTTGKGYFSGEFFLRFGGMAAALLLLWLYAHLLARCLRGYRRNQLPLAAMMLGLLAVILRNAGRVVGCWTQRGIPKWIHFPITYSSKLHRAWAWPFAQYCENCQTALTVFLVSLAVLLMVILFIGNTKVKDPYDNPAQLRKLRAKARSYRRHTAGVVVCAALAVVCMTAVKAYANQEPAAPAIGEYTEKDGYIYVNVEDVNDGELHRFVYTTPNGVKVRWIVIKKPNSASYGTGLDACDVCGVDKESTYFQRGSQVVCRRCDVVMNINTIGIYGGCNPIPLSYKLENGKMVFSLEDVLAGESRFAK